MCILLLSANRTLANISYAYFSLVFVDYIEDVVTFIILVKSKVCVKPSSQYAKNAQRAFDASLKCKDRIDFYPCVADAPVDTSDRTCHKFIAE